MNYFKTISSMVFVAGLAVGCDKAADEQARANNAQAQANNAQAQANDKNASAADMAARSRSAAIADSDKATAVAQSRATAQADAERMIAATNAAFITMREDFRHKTTDDLAELDRKIELLDGKSRAAAGAVHSDLEAQLKLIREKRAVFAADYKSIEASVAGTWEDTKRRLDREWLELRSLVDRA